MYTSLRFQAISINGEEVISYVRHNLIFLLTTTTLDQSGSVDAGILSNLFRTGVPMQDQENRCAGVEGPRCDSR